MSDEFRMKLKTGSRKASDEFWNEVFDLAASVELRVAKDPTNEPLKAFQLLVSAAVIVAKSFSDETGGKTDPLCAKIWELTLETLKWDMPEPAVGDLVGPQGVVKN